MSDDEPSFEALKAAFLERFPTNGQTIGNKGLRTALGWDLEQYQRVREELVAGHVLQLGRGYGGTVRRAVAIPAAAPIPAKDGVAANYSRRELTLYPGFLQGLLAWARDQDWTDHVTHQIAHQGRRNTGGSWTRPDFVVVGYKKFEYTPGIVRDVETFEVKPSNSGIDAVFETAAHSRFATKSYLAIEHRENEPTPEDLNRIESECQRFGLGLILFADPKDFENWTYPVEPARHEPDPFNLEKFIQDQIPKTAQEKIRKWLH